jgi:hypothetical protein
MLCTPYRYMAGLLLRYGTFAKGTNNVNGGTCLLSVLSELSMGIHVLFAAFASLADGVMTARAPPGCSEQEE